MRQLVVDVENTIDFPYDERPDEIDGSPYNPNNKLVSVGFKDRITGEVWYFDDMENDAPAIQALLDEAEYLIGHNIKHDYIWLKACGFRVPRTLKDTMVREYVFAKGRRIALSLKDCAVRRKLDCSKGDLLDRLMIRKRGGEGLNIDQIPKHELREYNIDDLHVTASLFAYQEENDWGVMTKAVDLMHDAIPVLAEMEMAGAAVDMDALLAMEMEFKEKLSVIKARLDIKLQQLMGDKPYNMNSPDDMSAILYSRAPTNKDAWRHYFNIGSEQRGAVVKKKRVNILNPNAFNRLVNAMNTVYKTRAEICPACGGTGYKRKIKKDGTPYAKAFTCSLCKGQRVNYVHTGVVAGLKLKPRNEFVSQSGFAAGKDAIQYYLEQDDLSDEAREFLTLIDQYNRYDTWINTFIASLKKYTRDGLIHTSYNQCITATGRLSATKPNMQNQPKRNEDFPIRKVFVSRWEGGKLSDADFGQLEFRIAAFLSQCEKAIQAVKDGVDIHSLTRDFYHGKLEYKPNVLRPEMTRQEAKAETFGPLYGKITEWTKQFYALFPGIEQWHEQLMSDVMNYWQIETPSGRVYQFPDPKRFLRRDGRSLVSNHTQIKNYPVQGFATGDMVLLVMLDIHEYLTTRNAQSKVILQVHDSVTTDTHPDEIELVASAYRYAFDNVYAHAKRRFGIDINVPLAFDLSIGDNWLEQSKFSA